VAGFHVSRKEQKLPNQQAAAAAAAFIASRRWVGVAL